MNRQVLLTWDAYNHGFVVTAETVALLARKHKIDIDEILYLQNRNLRKLNLTEIDVFLKREKLDKVIHQFDDARDKKRLQRCYELSSGLDKLPKFRNINLNIKGVTHYQSIFDSIIEFLKKEVYDKPRIHLHINVSPGTPHMHVVWLMLNASGYLPENTTLWSSQWVQERDETVLEPIIFKPRTYLSEVFHSAYERTQEIVINPNDTQSKLRQEAENRLQLFAAIPNAPLLIIGERGTGKSTYVKNLIKQENQMYRELPCGIFNEDLMRSELFGYEKGAFTGASDKKAGILSLFQEGGVLFLDEIHDLSKSLQRQLMQVLQTKEYYPIGADKPHKANFRLVSASNLSYSELANDRLDPDFFDRVARFVVHVPPLRHSKDDIRSYWSKVWAEIADFGEAPEEIWNKEIEKFLDNNELSGNFRDLQKLASYLIAFYINCRNEKTASQKAIKEFRRWEKEGQDTKTQSYFGRNKSHQEIVAQFEKDLTEWAIKEYGSKRQAAKMLDRSESMLDKYLKLNRLKKNE